MASKGLYVKIPTSISHTVFTEKTTWNLGGGGTPSLSIRTVPYFRAAKSYKVTIVQFIFRDGKTKIQKDLPELDGITWTNLSPWGPGAPLPL